MKPLFYLLPELNGRTAEELAYSFGLDPGTPEFDKQVAALERTGTEEYQTRIKRWHDRYVAACQNLKKNERGLAITQELIRESLTEFLYAYSVDDRMLEDEDLKTVQARYGPWNLYTAGTAGWPSGKWCRFGQTRWEKSRWLMVPDLPSATLAMAGIKLHTPARYMGDLTDEEVVELAEIHDKSQDPKQHLDADEAARLHELLERCPFGGELPVFDVDSVGPKDPEKLTAEQLLEENIKLARRGAEIARETDALWREMTDGAAVQWTVTNDRGGLHGRHLRCPPTLRHPYLCIALEAEVKRRAAERLNLPILVKEGEENRPINRIVRVSLDLTSFHKTAHGRGGVWRAPGCKKSKAGSLPQTPVERYLKKMPWLDQITPSALGSGPVRLGRDAIKRILKLCDEFQHKVEEEEIKAGYATRNPITGEVKRKRATILKPDLALGTTEFTETAKAIRAVLPERGGGVSRHEVRMALAGWLIRSRVPVEAVLATLMASAGNPEDSRDAVESTVYALKRGSPVASISKLAKLLGAEAVTELTDGLNADLEYKRYYEMPQHAESADTMEIGLDPNEGDVDVVREERKTEAEAEQTTEDSAAQVAAAPTPAVTAGQVAIAPKPASIKKELQPGDDREFYAYSATQMASLSVCRELKKNEPWEAPSESDYETPAERQLREEAGIAEYAANQLARFSKRMREVLRGIPSDKRWFAEKAIAGIFALSAIGKKTVSKALHAAGMGSTVNEVTTTLWAIKRWKHGREKAPKIAAWSFLKQAGVKHKDIVSLQEALSEDLEALHAPSHVRRHCMTEQPWRSHERRFMSDVNDGFQGFSQVNPNARRAQIQKVERVVNGSAVLEVDYRGERTKVTVELTSLLLACEPPYLTVDEDDGNEVPVWFETVEQAVDAERAAIESGAPPDPTDPKPFVVEQAETLVGRSFGMVKDVKALKAVRDACQCMTVGHEKHCRTHGEVGLIFTRCKRETACPSCRSLFWDFINRWINDMKSWPEQVVVAKILPTPGPVVVDERAQVEIEKEEADEDKKGDKAGEPPKPPEKKPESSMSAWLETTNLTETLPDGRRRYRVPTREEQRRQEAEEQKHRMTVARKRLAEKRAKAKANEPEKKPTRSRKVGEHTSNSIRDRIRHAVEHDPSMKLLAGNPDINRVLGIRAWAGLKAGVVFLPATFIRTREDGTPYTDENGDAIVTNTLEYLRTIGAFQAPENELKLVSRAEACHILLALRDEIAESFDFMVLDFTQKAHETLRRNGQEAYRLKVRELGARLLAHEFLQPGAMRPLKHNRMSDSTLPWFTDEQQADFMRAKAEEEGRDRDRCPVLVKKHETDLGCPCGQILETVTIDIRSGGVLLKNRNGYTPSREEAWDAFKKAGLTVGEYRSREHWIPLPGEVRAAG